MTKVMLHLGKNGRLLGRKLPSRFS